MASGSDCSISPTGSIAAAGSSRGRPSPTADQGPSRSSPRPPRRRRPSPDATTPGGRSPDSRPPPPILPSETSSLLHQLNDEALPDHGTFTPRSRPTSPSDVQTDAASDGDTAGRGRPSWRARLSRRIKSKKVRNSRALAREAGVEYNKMM